ncbi:hypothetical protein BU26DRAFT_603379 [Trematosphaeria pertusa]|uniref:BTB domain-containing protein n=1 Tax=Trematosphaeria pertusa TaxID=390896 RepID=A0A6A6IMQ1_9PLEO|nr:uncharacterized protein BU26DRAFT_603379 [Trematosphaeria pertusa]KAF2250850.1 hypothetical protein BU26DRAFT_603379 [Trematosphaeria pertusa]
MPTQLKTEPGVSGTDTGTPAPSTREQARATATSAQTRFGTPSRIGEKPPSVASTPSSAPPAVPAFDGGSVLQARKKMAAQAERFSHNRILDFGIKVRAVRVGTESQHTDFTVHENLLRRSPFFVSPLDPCGSGDAGAFTALPDHKPTAFTVYVQWLYSGRLHTKPSKEETTAVGDPLRRQEWLKLVDAYILGEYLGDIDFRDTVIDAMLGWFHEAQTQDRTSLLDSVGEVYMETSPGSPLCRLLSDIVAWHFEDRTLQEMKVKQTSFQLPPAFLLDTLVKLSSRFQGAGMAAFGRGSPVNAGRGTCIYHCHGPGDKACYKTWREE